MNNHNHRTTHPYFGVGIAVAVIGLWIASMVAFFVLPWRIEIGVLGLLWMTFLSTGLFITAHDAMHGTVCPGHPGLNAALGTVAVRLYALFSYAKLREKHHEHHHHPAEPGADPDYHDGEHPAFWRWYLNFVGNYIGLWQVVGMAVVYNVLAHLAGVAEMKLIVFWVAPALLSTLQLFYFGTYLPHRGSHDNGHHARSNNYPTWLSFLTCYHFGYHLEHHERPDLPWWRLPTIRSR